MTKEAKVEQTLFPKSIFEQYGIENIEIHQNKVRVSWRVLFDKGAPISGFSNGDWSEVKANVIHYLETMFNPDTETPETEPSNEGGEQ